MIYPAVKRVLDFSIALIGGLLFFPFALIIALCIKVESEGPIFFRQQRVGKNCKVFVIYKFRTMRVETEKNSKPFSDMQRMTKVGIFLRKTSLDEVPQILNILRGDMSFIGPRPLLPQYLPRYTPEQNRRHEVLPGITGLAQVNGRNAISWEEKFKHDVQYVDHVSFLTDLRIVGKTFYYVVFARNVNQSRGVTMEEFMGEDNINNGRSESSI